MKPITQALAGQTPGSWDGAGCGAGSLLKERPRRHRDTPQQVLQVPQADCNLPGGLQTRGKFLGTKRAVGRESNVLQRPDRPKGTAGRAQRAGQRGQAPGVTVLELSTC